MVVLHGALGNSFELGWGQVGLQHTSRAVDSGRRCVRDWIGAVLLVAEVGSSVRNGVLMTRTDIVLIWSMVAVIVILLCGALVSGIRAQVPPTIVQELNGYPPAFVLYWQVGTTPPACNVTQANGSPGPPLYSLAIRQGPPD